ncbi:MAG TPA: hypothetical protein VGI10_18185 [Polyangiaceae bacterium]|jgi:GMP synthase-like glutamine amidotransferase
MKRAIVLLHAEFEGPARLATLLVEHGYELDVRALHRGAEVPHELAPGELLLVMGGPMGVADLERTEFPFLRREFELLGRCVAEGSSVLGICLGAQLLAHAAGAAAYPMRNRAGARVYEVGWAPLDFHVQADERVLAGMPAQAPMLHWHGDTYDLPAAAQLLASTPLCKNQAFHLNHRQFGLQFHCEVGPDEVAAFLREDPAFVRTANGPDGAERLRRDTSLHIDGLRAVGERLLRNILGVLEAG